MMPVCCLRQGFFAYIVLHYIVKDDLELLSILCLPPKEENLRPAPTSPAYKIFLIGMSVVLLPGRGGRALLVTLHKRVCSDKV